MGCLILDISDQNNTNHPNPKIMSLAIYLREIRILKVHIFVSPPPSCKSLMMGNFLSTLVQK